MGKSNISECRQLQNNTMDAMTMKMNWLNIDN